ncbi:anthranilate phosphoribosyltransferase [Basilea psittacipulmonis]|uniref:Anthranilate phosphoribosyltransferase n=1 Tax=Basilea psittacipulmonis DSM 24701 TaxID=1072685 RepID=A0A077DCX5_9BURK|nr:anthranilate phosphoribosyltransferase [Basilea psittacipulmonis]AIL32459.1 anthranilate phosphoribosyltransferase [Basilea psittacipulmonis DSM 24701]
MNYHEALTRCIEHREIFHDEMLSLMRQMMSGVMPESVMAALLMGLRVKKETIGEITAAATVMREFSTKVDVPHPEQLLDLCGTGGDGMKTFNISTATMFVAAAAGVKIAKHGNRSASSSSGSADVLEALGVKLDLTPEEIKESIERTGIGFMFAPRHHSAMKYVAPVRKLLGVKTIFNILGPLTNPARAANQLMGVFHPDLVGIQVRVLKQLGSQHVLVIHGEDGLDEATLCGHTLVGELKDGEIAEYRIHPHDFGLNTVDSLQALVVENAQESAQMIRDVLDNQAGVARDIVIYNAGLAIYAGNQANSIQEGIVKATEMIETGQAKQYFQHFCQFHAA